MEFQDREIGSTFKIAFEKHLKLYFDRNQRYPTNVVVFRDGVGDGQLNHCKDFEVAQFESTLQELRLTNTKLTFVVVQKRINTKVYLRKGSQGFENPPPGTIMDNTVTRKNW